MAIQQSLLATPQMKYCSNATEADMRIRLHVLHTEQTQVYNIGLTIVQSTNKECIVQVKCTPCCRHNVCSLNKLIQPLISDPDLGSIPRHKVNSVIQMFYISSGCDYISFFIKY